MAVLTKNGSTTHLIDQELREFPVGAAVHIWRGALVGIDPAGQLKAMEPGDEFVGIAYEESDNTASGASAGDKVCQVYVEGDFEFTLTSAALTDAGKALYATDDATLALVGHPDAFVGRVMHFEAANLVVFRMKPPFEQPKDSDNGSHQFIYDFTEKHLDTGAAGSDAEFLFSGMILSSALGLGVKKILGEDGGIQFDLDNPSEIAHCSVCTPGIFPVSGGITHEARLHLSNIGTVAVLDSDWGLIAPVLATAIRVDVIGGSATDRCHFHMDGGSANILGASDDQSNPVAPVDTGFDNVVTANAFRDFKTICRPNGDCEQWIDRVRVNAATAFKMLSSVSAVCGFINMEKTADTTVGVLDADYMRTAGAHS